jgi:hypothetical protein
MKKIITFFMVSLVISLLSACMYPDEELAKNKIPYEDQIKSVQSSVDQYRAANDGLLPIKTKEADTPIYQKYPIDFKKIVPAYMAEIPGNAYENGGVFQYVLVDVEKEPKVKLLDLKVVDIIREIKMRIQSQGFPPFKERVSENLFTLNFKKIGYKEDPVAVSPFTQKNLPFLIDGKGEIYIDYRIDLYEKLKGKDHSYKEGDDIRDLLVQESVFVPAFSAPYTIDLKTNEPIFLAK